MKTLVVTSGLLVALAACSDNSPSPRGAGTSASTVTASGLANVGEPCGGGDPSSVSAASAPVLCDETKNLYCQQDPNADPSAPGTCAACAALGETSLVCNDGTIQPGQWVAIDQTCQIVGCGDAQLGEACDDTAPDPSVTCAYPLVCAQSVCADSAATGDDAGPPTAEDSGTGEDADPTSTTDDVDAGVDTTSDDAGPQQQLQRRIPAWKRR